MKITKDFLRQVIAESLEEMGADQETGRPVIYVILDGEKNIRCATTNHGKMVAAREELASEGVSVYSVEPNWVLQPGEATELP